MPASLLDSLAVLGVSELTEDATGVVMLWVTDVLLVPELVLAIVVAAV